ncbi:hypothetical protein CLV95_1333 [Leptospira borgpetersenii serovar Javanica]|nr:hypothetical protein CLV95_1333 [Leptospira borgpetersenii serovar Javanica]
MDQIHQDWRKTMNQFSIIFWGSSEFRFALRNFIYTKSLATPGDNVTLDNSIFSQGFFGESCDF